ncbi:cell cycle checkpoint control protein RAD9A isoform X2 [Phyllobates terribilis]|uniref:cell cycle checkpoint control protein RAD9A isoform X2 n=1 Tax=Phyllobates terribilis TaxID=111132 RepID=UPI003CCA9448
MGAGVKCVITGANIKALGRAIHSLSRIGEELYFEPLDDGLCLRSVNSSRSAYACFTLAPLFFYAYEATGGTCHCKIYMKSVMSVFRSLPSLEKTVEKCAIKLNTDSSRLVIQLFCKYGVTKTHNLSYQDCESLQAVYNPASCPNVLRANARLLSDAVVHFPLTLAEVTLGASPCGKVTLRNYVEEEIDPSKAMLTELSLSREEFLAYQLQDQREITFCLREFRGLLAFAESSSLPISIHFDSAGCPVVFSVDDAVLEAHFVLATLSDADQASQSQNHRPCLPNDDDFLGDDLDYMIAMETTLAGASSPPRSPTFNHAVPVQEEQTLSSGSEDDQEREIPGTPPNKRELQNTLMSGLQDSLSTGVISQIPEMERGRGHYSQLFLVRKSSGVYRIILNLKPLNEYITYRRFKMESIKSSIPLIGDNLVMATIDIQNAYYYVPFNPAYRKFLRFAVTQRRQILHFQFNVLPFRISSAPQCGLSK